MLTANQTTVLSALKAEVEGRVDHATDNTKEWGCVYLPNCRGFGTREFAGTLGSLETAGLYMSVDRVFGRVLVDA